MVIMTTKITGVFNCLIIKSIYKMENGKKYLTVKEVRERFKISRQTLDRAAEAGKISKLKISDGRKVLFIESELEALFSLSK